MSSLVLVTGASGYIGRRLVNVLLRQGVAVRAVARDAARIKALWPAAEIEAVSADLARPQTLAGVCDDVHTVFHLASSADESSVNANQALAGGTVVGTRMLLADAVRGGAKRFIFMSSVKAMGEGGQACLTETSPALPVSSYGRAKHAAEHLVFEAGRRHGLHVCALRLPLVYGGGDSKGNLPRMIAAIDRGRFPPLPETGNKRSMVHVDDVVQATLLAAERPQANGQLYLVTDGRDYSTREIYLNICSALGKSPPCWVLPLACLRVAAKLGDGVGFITRRGFPINSETVEKLTGSAWYSPDKIRRELDFRPAHTLIDALPEMVAHYRGQNA